MATGLLGAALAALLFSLVLGPERGGIVCRGLAVVFGILAVPVLLLEGLRAFGRFLAVASVGSLLGCFVKLVTVSAVAAGALWIRCLLSDAVSGKRSEPLPLRARGKEPVEDTSPSSSDDRRR